MNSAASIVAYLAAIAGGISCGVMLTGAVVLVPYWRSVPAADFLVWFAANADRMLYLAGPIQTATVIFTVVGAILFAITHRPGTVLLCGAAVLAIGVLVAFPLYFRAANASFVSASIQLADVPAELSRWAFWQWIRSTLGILAFVLAVLALARSSATASA